MMESLTGTLAVALRVGILGAAWGWAVPRLTLPGKRPWVRSVCAGAVMLALGVGINALVALLLGEWGVYHWPWPEAPVLALVAMVGLVWGIGRDRSALRRFVLDALPVLVLFAVWTAALLAFPPRGEWILGGWDPGIYLNEGVVLARQGTLHPPDTLFARELLLHEQKNFTRTGKGRTERFEGVLVDRDREAFTYEFLRLTPAWIGVLYRCGGARAALAVNGILMPVVLLVFMAILLHAGTRAYALFGVTLLAAQPLLLYHMHIPVSEMLHLVLLLGVGLMLACRHRGLSYGLFGAFMLLLLMLNRFSFMPFGGLLLVLLAWRDFVRPDRGRVWSLLGLFSIALAAGGVADFYLSPHSIRGWKPTPVLLAVFAGCVLLSAAINALGGARRLRDRFGHLPRWATLVPPVMGMVIIAALQATGMQAPRDPESDNVLRLLPYIGWAPVILAVIGAFLLAWKREARLSALKTFLLLLLGVTLVLLKKKWAVDVYPWATRRYLCFTVPLVAALAAYPLAALWQVKSRRGHMFGRLAALGVVLVVLGTLERLNRHAIRRTEYSGALAALDAIAAQVEQTDVLVVDHQWWGTPLALWHDRQTLNGSHFYRASDSETMVRGLAALRRLHQRGRRVRFLTSTDEGLAIYPLPVKGVALDWQSDPLTLDEIIHARHGSDFVTRERHFRFRIYSVTGEGF